jgi:phosphoribosylglycinamide formyltransferase 1
MKALVEQAQGYEVVLVASNNPLAPGLEWARDQAIETWAQDSRGIEKSQWESALDQILDEQRIGTIALAGFMRILSGDFTRRWAGRIVNIHPSLLPKYRGLHTHRRAIEAGDSLSGCSVHLVTDELDAGEVIARAEVPVLPDDNVASLESRVLAAEHQLYPKALAQFVARS